MDRVANIRAEEKKYHDACYDNYRLFEPGSWLHRPVATVMELLHKYQDQAYLSVLDLGCGIGRNSIPIAESMKHRDGQVVCVDILESAIDNLHRYSRESGTDPFIVAKLAEIEQFTIESEAYDIIVAVSALEHVSSENALGRILAEMNAGTRVNGCNCIIIGSNIREVTVSDGQELDPMFEVNLSTGRMLELLDQHYADWEVDKRFVKQLEYEIDRDGQAVKLSTDCITFVARKISS